jgi:hypothetical protein
MTGQRIEPVRYATQPKQSPNSVATPTKATAPPGFPKPVETDCGARCQRPNPTLGRATRAPASRETPARTRYARRLPPGSRSRRRSGRRAPQWGSSNDPSARAPGGVEFRRSCSLPRCKGDARLDATTAHRTLPLRAGSFHRRAGARRGLSPSPWDSPTGSPADLRPGSTITSLRDSSTGRNDPLGILTGEGDVSPLGSVERRSRLRCNAIGKSFPRIGWAASLESARSHRSGTECAPEAQGFRRGP